MNLTMLTESKMATWLKGALGEKESISFSDIVYHSDQVKPGALFVAIRGFHADGHDFVRQAIERGAKAVVIEREMTLPKEISKFVVEDTRDALARLSCLFFGEPSKKLRLVGVTGTNGKTTLVYLLEAILALAGRRPSSLTTVRYRWGNVVQEASRTTPESYDLQKMLAQMVGVGTTDCVMEVTSHAVDLKRIVGCHFDGAIFTNISGEHLDFHRDLESYFSAKARVFQENLLVSEKRDLWAVLDGDDPWIRKLKNIPARVALFGTKEENDYYPKSIHCGLRGTDIRIATPTGELEIESPLIGRFNVLNLLAGIAASCAMQIPSETIQEAICHFSGVPGRMERIPNDQGLDIFIDYAHTPAALQALLTSLKELAAGKLWVVFGCGGNRDQAKRPLMGEVAGRFADEVVITDDNPRDEDRHEILQAIETGLKKVGCERYHKIADREEAIAFALKQAAEGDSLVVAGKGHERYQWVAGERRPFEDRVVLCNLLRTIS